MSDLSRHFPPPKESAYTFKIELPADQPVCVNKATYKCREDWFENAMTHIRANNLNYMHHAETPEGYSFTFQGFRDFMVFDLFATGDKKGAYRTATNMMDGAFIPFYIRAAEIYLWDKGGAMESEDKDTYCILIFECKSDLVAYLTGMETIHKNATAAYKNDALRNMIYQISPSTGT